MDELISDLRKGWLKTNHHVCASCGVPVERFMRKPCVGQFRCNNCRLRLARENTAKQREIKKAKLARKLAKKVLD